MKKIMKETARRVLVKILSRHITRDLFYKFSEQIYNSKPIE